MRPFCTADNLTTCLSWLSENLGASTSWNLKGLSNCFAFLQGPYNNGKYSSNSASHPISLEPEECHHKNIKSHIQYFLLHEFPWLTYCFLCSMRPWVLYTLLCTASIFTFQALQWIGQQITPYQNNVAKNVTLPNKTGNYMLCSTVLSITISVCTSDTGGLGWRSG
jgi:hypothetical protein